MKLLKPIFLFAFFDLIFVLFFYLLFNENFLIFFFLILLFSNIIFIYYLETILIRIFRARTIDKNDKIINLLKKISIKTGIKTPKLYVYESSIQNALCFGVSKNKASILLSSSLIDKFSSKEMEALLSYEFYEIKNNEIFTNTLLAFINSFIVYLFSFNKDLLYYNENMTNSKKFLNSIIFSFLIVPLCSFFTRYFVSTNRVFNADYGAKQVMGSGVELSNLLLKLDRNFLAHNIYSNNLALYHLFIYNPVNKKLLLDMFNTHPSITTRVNKLLYEY